ncbi:MAG: hypothetical protein M1828_007063 [Chrysothrix sp. TS-e1954]|nr:MAG: hypothetical protein M1828_007063 [Chrysothrix sp. TS-e1954]
MVFEVIGIVNPDAKWVDKLDEEHKRIAAIVKEKEPNCLSYVVFKQTDEQGLVTFVVHEVFKAEADFQHHFHAPYSEALSELIVGNNMCSERGMEIKFVERLAGFEGR